MISNEPVQPMPPPPPPPPPAPAAAAATPEPPPPQTTLALPTTPLHPPPHPPLRPATRNLLTLIGIFNSVHLVQEIIEPILRLILDLLTVILLGITFCVQSVSVMISFDSVVSGIFKSLSRTVAVIISTITNTFLSSESERKIVSQIVVNYCANIIWTYIAYQINLEIYTQFFFVPMICIGLMTIFCQVYMIRNQIQMIPSWWNQRVLSAGLVVLIALIYVQINAVSAKSLPVMLLLMKVPINTVYLGIEVLIKLAATSNEGINHEDTTVAVPIAIPLIASAPATVAANAMRGTATGAIGVGGGFATTANHAEYDSSIVYVIEILRMTLWTVISAYEYSLCFHPLSSPSSAVPLPATESALLPNTTSSSASLNESAVVTITTTIMNLINETLVNVTGQPALSPHWIPVINAATASLTPRRFYANTPAIHYHSKKDRWFYLLLLFHDVIHLTMPIKKLAMKILKDAYINQQFPRITQQELDSLPRDDRCSICLCDHNLTSVRLTCSHILHQQCLNRILQDARTSRCPICRAEILRNNGAPQDFILGSAAAIGVGGGAVAGGEGNNQHETAYELRDVIRVRIITPTMRLNNIARTTNNPAPTTNNPTTVATTQLANQPPAGNQNNFNNQNGNISLPMRSRLSFSFNNTSIGVSHGINPAANNNPAPPNQDRVLFRATGGGGGGGGSGENGGLQYIRLNFSDPSGATPATAGSPGLSSIYANQTLDELYASVLQRVERNRLISTAAAATTATQQQLQSPAITLNENSSSAQAIHTQSESSGSSSSERNSNDTATATDPQPMEGVEALNDSSSHHLTDKGKEEIVDLPSNLPNSSSTAPFHSPTDNSQLESPLATTTNSSRRRGRKRSIVEDASITDASTQSSRKGRAVVSVPVSASKRRKSIHHKPVLSNDNDEAEIQERKDEHTGEISSINSEAKQNKKRKNQN